MDFLAPPSLKLERQVAVMMTPLRPTTRLEPLAPLRPKEERPAFLEPWTPPSPLPPIHSPCLVKAARGGAGEEPLPPLPQIIRKNLEETLRAADVEEADLNERRMQRYVMPPPPSPVESEEEHKELSSDVWVNLTQEEQDELNAMAEAWDEERDAEDAAKEAEYWADVHCGARCDGRCRICLGYNGSGYEGGVDV